MSEQSFFYKNIPSVNILLEELTSLFPQITPIYLKRIIVEELEQVRQNPKKFQLDQKEQETFTIEMIERLTGQVRQLLSGSLKPVINATGVVLHTGLGRAPVNPEIAQKMVEVSRYANLEINIADGRRGQRNDHLAPLLRLLTGAQDGLAVNNNAAAVLLMLNTVGKRKEVILSRGEMIEIGGSFRLPEVMKLSGCKLREIGTTNKTHLHDYEEFISSKTGGILICHPSNFEIQGFTEKPPLLEIVQLAHRHHLPVMFDLGSGSLINRVIPGADSEPPVSDIVEAGVDLISFSGDKLLGSAQAGLIVGKKEWVRKCANNHLLRALRLDKFIIKALQETLIQYLCSEQTPGKIAGLHMLRLTADELKKRCETFTAALPEMVRRQMEIAPGFGKVGSGAFPTLKLESFFLKINPQKMSAEKLARFLRQYSTPIFAFIEADCVFIDLRTVDEREEILIRSALQEILAC